MKKILSLGLAALMTVFALAGCGADKGTDNICRTVSIYDII